MNEKSYNILKQSKAVEHKLRSTFPYPAFPGELCHRCLQKLCGYPGKTWLCRIWCTIAEVCFVRLCVRMACRVSSRPVLVIRVRMIPNDPVLGSNECIHNIAGLKTQSQSPCLQKKKKKLNYTCNFGMLVILSTVHRLDTHPVPPGKGSRAML